MASDATGDAATFDEQPGAQKIPEADGNPPAGKPCLEEFSGEVPPARPPPRLCAKGRSWLQFHTGEEHKRAMKEDDLEHPPLPPVRSLLINRSYLNAFFDTELFGPAKIWINGERTIDLGKSVTLIGGFARTFEGIAALLQLARELTTIKIVFAIPPFRLNVRLVRKWQRIAAELHALPFLVSIHVNTYSLKHPFADILIHSLPDRVIRLKTDSLRIATLLRKRTTPLESAKFEIHQGEHPYIADVLRLKSSRIELTSRPLEEPPQLHPLHDCGPLDRNEHLQELHIWAEDFGYDGIPRALRYLRAINDHFKLVWHEACGVCLQESLDLEQVEDIADMAKEFAAIMSQAGFGQEGSELRIRMKDSEKWQNVSHEQLFERLNWAREGVISWPEHLKSLPTCSLVHDGIGILIGLDNPR